MRCKTILMVLLNTNYELQNNEVMNINYSIIKTMKQWNNKKLFILRHFFH